jgi:dimeric dUTPase (all-alpha-NTP-PPase superfamily)
MSQSLSVVGIAVVVITLCEWLNYGQSELEKKKVILSENVKMGAAKISRPLSKGEEKMNFKKMYEIQNVLATEIEMKHPETEKEGRSNKKFLGLLTEIAECANEHREFKFWSTDQKPRPSLKEEYVDGIHWLLEYGLDHNFRVTENYTIINENDDVTEQFLHIFYLASELWFRSEEVRYHNLFAAYLGLGNLFGYSTDEIEAAYYEKNEKNMKRQEEGY